MAQRTGRRVLVVLDEFQAVAGVPPVDAVIRLVIQHQRERVSYLFAGSEQSLLDSLFSVRAAPRLYGQAERLVLPPLAPELNHSQRKALRLAAWREPFYGSAARRLGLPKSAAQAAEATLTRLGLLADSPRRTLVDPLLGEWLRRRNPRP